MYDVVIPIHINGTDYETGEVVSAGDLGIYLPDLVEQKAVVEKEESDEPVP